jgi:hypothetical protein
MTWDNVAFSGVAGGIIGTLGAYGAAVRVIKKQGTDNRNLAIAQRREATALSLTTILMECKALLIEPEDDEDKLSLAMYKMMMCIPLAGSLSPEVQASLDPPDDLFPERSRKEIRTMSVGDLMRAFNQANRDRKRSKKILDEQIDKALEKAFDYLKA